MVKNESWQKLVKLKIHRKKRKTSITEYYAIQKKVNRTDATQGSKARKHDRKEKPDKFFQISE